MRFWRQAGYAATLFFSSGAALVVEIVASRLLAPYVGMSLYTWTAVIAVVLAGLSIGHWIGGVLAGRGDVGAGCRWVALALAAAGLTTLASLVLLRPLAAPVLEAALGPIAAIVLLTTGLFLLPSLFVGIVSPILTKLAIDDDPERRGRVLGRMYALGAVGSIFGTLSAGYFFLAWIGSIGTMIAVAAAYGVMAAGFAIAGWRGGRVATVTATAVIAVAAAGLTALGTGEAAFEGPCLEESDYYCMRVEDLGAVTGRASRVLVLDHLGHGINDRDDPTEFHSSYLQLTQEMVDRRFHGRAPDAFFIGGGAFTLPRAWAARYGGAADQLVAEIDPVVTEVARDHLWFDPTHVDVAHEDARALMQSLPAEPRFDVVFGDAFHDISIPAHLVTEEFSREVATRLRPGGMYAINVIDSARRPEFVLAFVRTLRRAFDAVEVWMDVEHLDDQGHITYLVVASDQPSPGGRLRSSQDDRAWIRWPPDRLDRAVAKVDPPVLTDDFAPVDRLMLPVLRTDP